MSEHTVFTLPLVSIIIVNYNGADILPGCLSSLNRFIPENYEIIVVDNASQDSSPDFIALNFPHITLVRLPENRGFGAGNNIGAKIATGEYLFLLNTDTMLTSNILEYLVELMEARPEVGVIGPKLLFPNGQFQISFAPSIGINGEIQARRLHKNAQDKSKLNLIEKKFQETQEVDIVVGAAFFIRASVFRKLGGFDEQFFMYFEESDLCKRVKNLGYKILYTPVVSLIHIRGHSIKKTANLMSLEYRRSQIYYYQKYRPLWENIFIRIYIFYKYLAEFATTFNIHNLEIVKLVVSSPPRITITSTKEDIRTKEYAYLWAKYTLEDKQNQDKRNAFKENLDGYLEATKASPEKTIQFWILDFGFWILDLSKI